MVDRYSDAARREWTEARRKALWSRLRTGFTSKPINLMDFAEVSQRLNLGSTTYRGVQTIPLNKIRGSTGRYGDFVQTFLPVNDNMGERWQTVARLYLDPNSRGWPPIEVYQVGNGYFVIDGNHRVSVAHQFKLPTIDAHVWEFVEPLAGLAPGADIDALLLEAERRSFLQQTRLDELRPGHAICLTVPGGYAAMLGQIAHLQQSLSWIDRTDISYEEAVTAWYDMIYTSLISMIQQARVLDAFPNRTPADFFIWVLQAHDRLDEQYCQSIGFEEAGTPLLTSVKSSLKQRWRQLKRRWGRRRPSRPNEF